MAVLSPISDYHIPISFSGLEEVGGVEESGEVSVITLEIVAAGQRIVLIFLPRQTNFSPRNKKGLEMACHTPPLKKLRSKGKYLSPISIRFLVVELPLVSELHLRWSMKYLLF